VALNDVRSKISDIQRILPNDMGPVGVFKRDSDNIKQSETNEIDLSNEVKKAMYL
jgi:hypothetical protein